MKISDAGLKLLKDSEGCELKAYRDAAGVLTIGYGDTGDVVEGQTITMAEAEARLASRLPYFERSVEGMVKVPLSQGQFDALMDFVYNLGSEALRASTLLRKLNAGDYAGAAAEFPRWIHAGSKVLPGLVKRRALERAMFEGAAT